MKDLSKLADQMISELCIPKGNTVYVFLPSEMKKVAISMYEAGHSDGYTKGLERGLDIINTNTK